MFLILVFLIRPNFHRNLKKKFEILAKSIERFKLCKFNLFLYQLTIVKFKIYKFIYSLKIKIKNKIIT